MGVNILLNKRVVDYRDHKVMLEDGSEIATRTFILGEWCDWCYFRKHGCFVDRAWRTY